MTLGQRIPSGETKLQYSFESQIPIKVNLETGNSLFFVIFLLYKVGVIKAFAFPIGEPLSTLTLPPDGKKLF